MCKEVIHVIEVRGHEEAFNISNEKKIVFCNYWNCFEKYYSLGYIEDLSDNKLYNYKKSEEVVVCHCFRHRLLLDSDQH